jgi:hypothetical protein
MLVGTTDDPGADVDGAPDDPGAMLVGTTDDPGAVVDGAPDDPGAMLVGTTDDPGAVVDGAPDEPGAMLVGKADDPGATESGTTVVPGAVEVGTPVATIGVGADVKGDFLSTKLLPFDLSPSTSSTMMLLSLPPSVSDTLSSPAGLNSITRYTSAIKPQNSYAPWLSVIVVATRIPLLRKRVIKTLPRPTSPRLSLLVSSSTLPEMQPEGVVEGAGDTPGGTDVGNAVGAVDGPTVTLGVPDVGTAVDPGATNVGTPVAAGESVPGIDVDPGDTEVGTALPLGGVGPGVDNALLSTKSLSGEFSPSSS